MTSETGSTGQALEQLETRIAEVVERHAELRARNAELEARLDALETELEQAQADAGGDVDGGGAAAWSEERDELRQRVERLVAQLESLAEG